jgi:chemotaxis protein MotB
MKSLFFILFCLGLVACVPVKKYNELLAKEAAATADLAKYKPGYLDFEAKNMELNKQVNDLNAAIAQLKRDTTVLRREFMQLEANYDKATQEITLLEGHLAKAQLMGAKDTKTLQSDLDARNLELQRKSDALRDTEKELKQKQADLESREKRVNELEEAILRRDENMAKLKDKLNVALLGFVNKGLTVTEKDGKIYLSLEAKLLFKTGSTVVEAEGIAALIQLSKVLENEKEMQILVEGHTDVDVLKSVSHPTDNWELSVLRATSVVAIMIKNSKIDPKQLTAAGRASFVPASATDKALNRRIEIIVTPKLDELYSIISKG